MQPFVVLSASFFVRAVKSKGANGGKNRRIAGRGADTVTDEDTDADTGTRQDHGAGGEVGVYPVYQIGVTPGLTILLSPF